MSSLSPAEKKALALKKKEEFLAKIRNNPASIKAREEQARREAALLLSASQEDQEEKRRKRHEEELKIFKQYEEVEKERALQEIHDTITTIRTYRDNLLNVRDVKEIEHLSLIVGVLVNKTILRTKDVVSRVISRINPEQEQAKNAEKIRIAMEEDYANSFKEIGSSTMASASMNALLDSIDRTNIDIQDTPEEIFRGKIIEAVMEFGNVKDEFFLSISANKNVVVNVVGDDRKEFEHSIRLSGANMATNLAFEYVMDTSQDEALARELANEFSRGYDRSEQHKDSRKICHDNLDRIINELNTVVNTWKNTSIDSIYTRQVLNEKNLRRIYNLVDATLEVNTNCPSFLESAIPKMETIIQLIKVIQNYYDNDPILIQRIVDVENKAISILEEMIEYYNTIVETSSATKKIEQLRSLYSSLYPRFTYRRGNSDISMIYGRSYANRELRSLVIKIFDIIRNDKFESVNELINLLQEVNREVLSSSIDDDIANLSRFQNIKIPSKTIFPPKVFTQSYNRNIDHFERIDMKLAQKKSTSPITPESRFDEEEDEDEDEDVEINDVDDEEWGDVDESAWD